MSSEVVWWRGGSSSGFGELVNNPGGRAGDETQRSVGSQGCVNGQRAQNAPSTGPRSCAKERQLLFRPQQTGHVIARRVVDMHRRDDVGVLRWRAASPSQALGTLHEARGGSRFGSDAMRHSESLREGGRGCVDVHVDGRCSVESGVALCRHGTVQRSA